MPAIDKWPPPNDRAGHITARHESSHAVIARLLGVEVSFASIESRPQVRTRCRSDELAIDARLVLVDLAGLATERQTGPAETDIKNAMRRCRKIAMDQSGTDTMTTALEIEAAILFVQLAVRAAELVDNNRQAIDAVATVLLERGTLTGSEIDAILCNRVYVDSTPGRRNRWTPWLRQLDPI